MGTSSLEISKKNTDARLEEQNFENHTFMHNLQEEKRPFSFSQLPVNETARGDKFKKK